MAIGLKKGDYLWSTSCFFCSKCKLHNLPINSAKVDLVDIERDTFNISLEHLKEKLKSAKKLKKLPKVLVIVHMGGNPCKMKEIKKIIKYL